MKCMNAEFNENNDCEEVRFKDQVCSQCADRLHSSYLDDFYGSSEPVTMREKQLKVEK